MTLMVRRLGLGLALLLVMVAGAQAGDVPWTPADTSTQLWLDAADASTLTQNGGAVLRWVDKSGNGHHATQTDTARQPTFTASDAMLGGRPAVGVNLQAKWLDIPEVSAKRIYAVMYYGDGTTDPALEHSAILSSTGRYGAYRVTLTNLKSTWNPSDNFNDAGTYRDGASAPSMTALPMPATLWRFDSSAQRSQTWKLLTGNNPNWTRWKGAVAEVIFTDGTETLETQQRIEGYLAHKWGVAGNLPESHPHKAASPSIYKRIIVEGQNLATVEDTALPVTLSATGIEGATLSYIVVDGPANGSLSGTAPELTYTPNTNFFGADSFTFKVNDGTEDSETVSVNITVASVNDAPVVSADELVLDEDTSAALAIRATDADGDELSYTLLATPENGELSGTLPELTYTPNPNFHGTASISMKVSDGTVESETVVITITVTSVNDVPTVSDRYVRTDWNMPVEIPLVAADEDLDELTFVIVSPPTHGALSGTAPNLVYTPNPGYSGKDVFVVQANDGMDDSSPATISIVVSPAWTPAQLSTVLWLDAADESTLTTTDGLVDTIADKSGNGYDFNDKDRRKPETGVDSINGLNVLTFSKDGMHREDGINEPVITLDANFFFVLSSTDQSDKKPLFLSQPNPMRNMIRAARHSGALSLFSTDSLLNTEEAVSPIVASDTVSILEVERSFAEGKVYFRKNGGAESSEAPMELTDLMQVTGKAQLLNYFGSQLFSGLFAELVIVNGPMSADEKAEMQGYLAHKWGLTDQLPADHPYKTGAPAVSANTWQGDDVTNPTLWSVAENWSYGTVPTRDDKVYVLKNDNAPELDVDADVGTLVLAQGATLSLNSFTLTVHGGACNLGERTALKAGTGTLTFAGEGKRQLAIAEGTAFGTLDLGRSEVTITAGFSADRLLASRGSVVRFKPGRMVTVGALDLQGAPEDAVVLSPQTPHVPWLLNLTADEQVLSHVQVADSDASAGVQIDATDNCRDLSGNTNWLFDPAGGITLPKSSITSPVCVEGYVQGITPTTIVLGKYDWDESLESKPNKGWGQRDKASDVDATHLNEKIWYADVPLSPNVDTMLNVAYDDEVVKKERVTWTPTLMDSDSAQSVTIRKGDSLLLGSVEETGAVLEIDTNSDGTAEVTGTPTDLLPTAFNTAGTFLVTSRIDGVATGYLSVTVVEVAFPEAVACEIGYTRTLEVSASSAGSVKYTSSSRDLWLSHAADSNNGATSNLFVQPIASGNNFLIARLGSEMGPILAVREVDEFEGGSAAERYIGVIEEYEDGSLLVGTDLWIEPKVEGLDFVLHIFVAGVTFADSTLDKTVNTSDFVLQEGGQMATYPYQMIMNEGLVNGPCHTIKIYQNGVRVGGM